MSPTRTLLIVALALATVLANPTQKPHDNTGIRIFKCPQQFGYFPAPLDPRKYWLCVNFVPFEQHCPDSLTYNKEAKQCKAAGEHKLSGGHVTTHKPTTKKPTTKKSAHPDYYNY